MQGKGSCLVGAKWAEAASQKRQLSTDSVEKVSYGLRIRKLHARG